MCEIERRKILKSSGGLRGRPGRRHADHQVQVAHGHILRAFTKRWLGYPLEFPLSMMIAPGGVGILRYVAPLAGPTGATGNMGCGV